MNPKQISKIIKHTGKLLQEILTQLFGEEEKEEVEDDQSRNKEPG